MITSDEAAEMRAFALRNQGHRLQVVQSGSEMILRLLAELRVPMTPARREEG